MPTDGLVCPKCGSKDVYTRRKDGTRRCRHCGHEWKQEMKKK